MSRVGGMRDENNGFLIGLDSLALRLQVILSTFNTALSLFHTVSSTALHTHWNSQFPLVVS
jgi:hypothetical protein